MTTARKLLVVEGEEATYHCWSRCVRRAFLCGTDNYTGQCFDHRREWIKERLKFLVQIFAIEVLAYSIMENHQHTLIRTCPHLLNGLSDEEIARRWLTLFPKKRNKCGTPKVPSKREIEDITSSPTRLMELRRRLGSVSWFMKGLNEHIARRANKEDECKGSFWEGRFKCTKVEDEAGLLVVSVYIDLNPVRAGVSETPEESNFTSVQERVESLPKIDGKESHLWIAPIQKTKTQNGYLSITLEEYLTVVDITGRIVRPGKRGKIPPELPPILRRLGIRPTGWGEITISYREKFSVSVGTAQSLSRQAKKLGKRWLKGIALSRRAFA